MIERRARTSTISLAELLLCISCREAVSQPTRGGRILLLCVLGQVLLGSLAKLTPKELATQTLYMVTAGLVFFGLVAMLPAAH